MNPWASAFLGALILALVGFGVGAALMPWYAATTAASDADMNKAIAGFLWVWPLFAVGGAVWGYRRGQR